LWVPSQKGFDCELPQRQSTIVSPRSAMSYSQRRVGEVLVDVRHAVGRDRHPQVADVRIERAVEDALLRHLPHQHEVVEPSLRQQVLERRHVEDRVARLEHAPAGHRPLCQLLL